MTRHDRVWILLGLVLILGAQFAMARHWQAVQQHNLVAGCQRTNRDRLDTLTVRRIQASSDQTIADDRSQSVKTRITRGRQAAIERASVVSQQSRVVDCEHAFPKPGFWPF